VQPSSQVAPVSNAALWTGRVISALLILFLVFDGVTKIMKVPQVMAATTQLGFPARLVPVIGTVLLICTLLYAVPRTSILGALLLTGYLGGAVVIQLRVGNPLFAETLFPVYFGILLSGALYVREPRLRALIPLRTLSE
jgi:hypothetical protein